MDEFDAQLDEAKISTGRIRTIKKWRKRLARA